MTWGLGTGDWGLGTKNLGMPLYVRVTSRGFPSPQSPYLIGRFSAKSYNVNRRSR